MHEIIRAIRCSNAKSNQSWTKRRNHILSDQWELAIDNGSSYFDIFDGTSASWYLPIGQLVTAPTWSLTSPAADPLFFETFLIISSKKFWHQNPIGANSARH